MNYCISVQNYRIIYALYSAPSKNVKKLCYTSTG